MTSVQSKKEICLVCNKTVFFNEKVSVDSVSYHADCFRCYKCKVKVNPLSYGKVEGFFFCKPHFEQKKKEVLLKIQYSGDTFGVKVKKEEKVHETSKETRHERSKEIIKEKEPLKEEIIVEKKRNC